MSTNTSSPVEQLYHAILQDVDALTRIIKEVAPRLAIAAPIAPVPKGGSVLYDADIPLQPVSGTEAVLAATQAYRDMHIHPDFCQKAARRTLGVLWYTPDQDERVLDIPVLVKRINDGKAAIEHYITRNYPARTARFEALRADCPGVMAVHLYRHIRCLNNQGVTKIRFAWLRKDLLNKPDKAELMASIEDDVQISSDERVAVLQSILAKVASTPAHQLRLRRRAPVQPAANIKVVEPPQRTLSANMPIILIQQHRPDIKPPVSFLFAKAARRKVRSDKIPALTLGTFAGYTIEVFPDDPAAPA